MAKPSGGGSDPRNEPDYSDIKGRLDKLGGKLDQVKGRNPAQPEGDPAARGKAMSFAFRLATELVAGVFVGGLIGWGLDRLLGTAPILLIVCLLLGVAGGLLNSVRAAQRMQKDLQSDR
jgi:ATP synthase protein I